MATYDSTRGLALPDYILERNRAALAAGLTIERQDISRSALTTWYRGTEAQWRASPFCGRTKPFTRSAMTMDFECFSAGGDSYRPGRIGINVQFRADAGDYRGSIAREPLPDHTEDLGQGITLYLFGARRLEDCDRAVYVGPAHRMIERGIAPREILSQAEMVTPAVGAGYYNVALWNRSILPDGRYCFIDYPGERRRQQREKQESAARMRADGFDDGKRGFAKPSQVAARWAAYAANFLRVLENEYSRFDGSAGTFAATADALTTIRELRDELVDAIRCADIRLMPKQATPTTTDPGRLSAARADTEFQGFMAAAMRKPKRGDSTGERR
jgi:hypothetical protein